MKASVKLLKGSIEMKKFDLVNALKENGFELKDSHEVMSVPYAVRKFSADDGREMYVEVLLYQSCCRAVYMDRYHRIFKAKDHLQDKRAFNAIVATVSNQEFAF